MGALSKSDAALNNVLRDIDRINRNIKKGIPNTDATSVAMNKKEIVYKDRKEDIGLTNAISNGYDEKRDKSSRNNILKANRKKEKELIALAEKYNMPIELLRKNPNIRPLNFKEIDAEADRIAQEEAYNDAMRNSEEETPDDVETEE